MGYSREHTIDALRATNWNLEDAIDRLEGDEDMEEGDMEQLHDIIANQDEETLLAQLVTDPLFRPIREQIRNDPSKANEYFLQLKDIRPDLYEMLEEDLETRQEIIDEIMQGSDHNEDGDEEGLEDSDEDGWQDDDAIQGNSKHPLN